jgi:hypothetical protein
MAVPGFRRLSTKEIKVDMLHLNIANDNLAQNRGSMTPDEPVLVDYNIDTGKYRLADGYHRYLQSRGGSIKAAIEQARNGVFPDLNVDIRLVKMENRGVFGDFEKPLSKEEGKQYIKNIFSKDSRLSRAREQGFDTETIWYHGTIPDYGEEGSDIPEFDKDKIGSNYWQDNAGFFLINSPAVASNYASHNAIGKSVSGGSAYPLYIALESPFVIDDKKALSMGLEPPSENGVIYFWDENHDKLSDINKNHDGVVIVDEKSGEKMSVVYEPHNIRSIYASFMDRDRKSASLSGHPHQYFKPPKKERRIVLSPEYRAMSSRVAELLDDYKELTPPQLTRKVIEVVDPTGSWDKSDKIKLFREMQENSFSQLPDDEKANRIVEFSAALSLEKTNSAPLVEVDNPERGVHRPRRGR